MNVDTLKQKLADIDADTLRNFIFDLYRLNYTRAKRADTSLAWINSIFLVMNLLILLRIFFAWMKKGVAVTLTLLLRDLQIIDDATCDLDMRSPPSNHFEKLRGNLAGKHSTRVNKQWRLVFTWSGERGEAQDIYLDNHDYR